MAREVTQGALNLDEWARERALTDDAVGELLGMLGISVWKIRHGYFRPKFAMMEAIAAITGGKSMPNDWMSDVAKLSIAATGGDNPAVDFRPRP
jgi:hypothetical protein